MRDKIKQLKNLLNTFEKTKRPMTLNTLFFFMDKLMENIAPVIKNYSYMSSKNQKILYPLLNWQCDLSFYRNRVKDRKELVGIVYKCFKSVEKIVREYETPQAKSKKL